jgi:hypothetical protein
LVVVVDMGSLSGTAEAALDMTGWLAERLGMTEREREGERRRRMRRANRGGTKERSCTRLCKVI